MYVSPGLVITGLSASLENDLAVKEVPASQA
jgi:hypothetical protein